MNELVKQGAFSGYEVKSEDVTIQPGSAVVRKPIPCSAGKRVIGAGWRQTKVPLERLGLWESGPSDDNAGWVFSVVNEGSKQVTVRLYVICAEVPAGPLTVTALTGGDLSITAAAGADHTVQLKVMGNDGLNYTSLSTFVSSDSGKASVTSPGGLVTGVAVTTAPTNEVQTVTINGSPTSGTFTLTFDGQTTAPIAHNATAATVQSALTALSNIGDGDVAVTASSAGGPYTVTFQGALAQKDVNQMTETHSFTPATATVSVATATPGVPPVKITASYLPAGQSTPVTGSAIITVV